MITLRAVDGTNFSLSVYFKYAKDRTLANANWLRHKRKGKGTRIISSFVDVIVTTAHAYQEIIINMSGMSMALLLAAPELVPTRCAENGSTTALEKLGKMDEGVSIFLLKAYIHSKPWLPKNCSAKHWEDLED